MFGIVQLGYGDGGGVSETVHNYQCKWCELQIRFKRKYNSPDNLNVLDIVNFPHYLLNISCGKFPHQEHCNTLESKQITKLMIVLNHPFFYDCHQAYLPLNSILAIHLKKGTTVKSIKHLFVNGDQNNLTNDTELSATAWNNIVHNMIDIL